MQPCLLFYSSILPVINQFLDIAEKDFDDGSVWLDNFDGRFAEGLRTAQVIYASAYASAIQCDDFDIFAVKHSL